MKVLLAIVFLSLVACTDREAEDPRREVRESNVFDPVTRDPIDRARSVEVTLQDSAAARRRALEEAEGR